MKNFEDVLGDYWDTAYREGEEHRILDDGTAQEALSWLQAYSREAEANKVRVASLEALLLACREQVDVEDRYVHDMAPIIEAMEALED